MHYVIVGTGYTGRRVAAQVAHKATAVSRSPITDLEINNIQLDLDSTDVESLNLPAPYSLLYTVPPAPNADPDPRLPRLLGLLNTHPERIVYLSTTGVYGNRDGKLTGESTTPAPLQQRAVRRRDAEILLQEYAAGNGCELAILRVPGIYGPGRLGFQRILSGAPVIAEEDATPGNRIHVDDLAACCVDALRSALPIGVCNVGDGDYRSGTWFANRTAELAGLPSPPPVTWADAEASFSEERLSFLSEPRRIDTHKMTDVLGFVPRYADPDEGIRASLAADGVLKDS